MPPKITLTTVTTLELVGNTNMANTDSQVIMMGQLYKVVD
jgi:hypothetical protein